MAHAKVGHTMLYLHWRDAGTPLSLSRFPAGSLDDVRVMMEMAGRDFALIDLDQAVGMVAGIERLPEDVRRLSLSGQRGPSSGHACWSLIEHAAMHKHRIALSERWARIVHDVPPE